MEIPAAAFLLALQHLSSCGHCLIFPFVSMTSEDVDKQEEGWMAGTQGPSHDPSSYGWSSTQNSNKS